MSTNPTGISAVLFDYGLVLTGPADPAAWERLKLVFHAPEDAFHAAYWKYRHAYDRGDLNGPAYWQAIAADLAANLTPEALRELIAADTALWTVPNQPMIDWAAALQQAGIRTGILSNLGDAMEEGVLARCPWLAGFHHHTFSHRLRLAKPEPEIYAHAARGLQTPPAEILFIDDRTENIAAATAAGMHTLLYADHAGFVRDMEALHLGALLHPPAKPAGT